MGMVEKTLSILLRKKQIQFLQIKRITDGKRISLSGP
jgi:hypothetical protein